jgi:hypothetical protein
VTSAEWRAAVAADRPEPTPAMLAALRPLITAALPRTREQAPPATTGDACDARPPKPART